LVNERIFAEVFGLSVAKSLHLDHDRNLVLIGGRACGKTSVGKALALALERPFVDLDEVLVAQAGCAIAELVAAAGWPEFRRREKALVEHYARLSGQVLAPGGGVVLDPENVKNLREHGLVIWLMADPGTLGWRLKGDQGSQEYRPSLTGADPVAEMARVLADRDPLYRAAAHLVIDTTELSIPEIVKRILHDILGEGPGK
jgi:shikimate kinase